jgi:DNA invertase Pin-like site-specific DNA recombinase
VGYVRESADPSAGHSAFEQQELIRRHALEHGHSIVAVCLDARAAGEALGRDGYLGLLGVIASGATDAVIVPGLSVLSSDQIVQEIMLWDLRGRGVRVISTDPGRAGCSFVTSWSEWGSTPARSGRIGSSHRESFRTVM